MNATTRLDSIFAALADPTRRAIVARLAGGERTVLELAEPFDISLPAISRHLKVLEHAGVIERGRDAQRRPCRLRAESLDEVTAWAEHTRRAWEQRFDQLDAYLKEMQRTNPTKETKPNDERATKSAKEKSHARKPGHKPR